MLNFEEENLQYILKDKRLLIFGQDSLHHLDLVFNQFEICLIEEITEYTIENLNTTISKNSIDVVIINSANNNQEVYNRLKELCEYEKLIILMCLQENVILCTDLINLSHSIFTPNIEKKLFIRKLYNAMPKQSLNSEQLMKDKDTYVNSLEIEIIFIRDELLYIAKKIDAGDISQTTISRVVHSLNRISKIYEHYLIYSEKIKKAIITFEEILKSVDVEKVESSNYESFDYLARIIEDVATFLDNYFVKRVYDDLYIVEDSMENSLRFLKASFENKDSAKDGSSLEFFND